MNARQARIGLIASLATIVLALAGIALTIGPPSRPLLDTTVVVDGECPPAMQLAVVNFSPDAALEVSLRPEGGEWVSLPVDAQADAEGKTVVALSRDVLAAEVPPCSPDASTRYQFRVSSDGDEAISEVSPLNDYPGDIVRDEPPPVGDAFNAPWLFPVMILGLIGLLVSGAFVAYPRRS